MVRQVEAKDVAAYAAHSVRAVATSGVPPTPIFMAISRRDAADVARITERNLRRWAIPVGEPDWARTWAVVDADGIFRGEAGLRGDKLPTQSHRAWLWLGLESEWRGRGVGEALMRSVLDWAQAQPSLDWVELGVFTHNVPARRLYERLGFVEVGRVVDAFRVDEQSVDDIHMTLDLRQRRWAAR